MPNPFLGGSLSGLIAARGNINTEGDSPFTAYMKRRKLGRIDEALNQFQAQPRPAPRPQPRPVAKPVAGPIRPPVAAPVAPAPVAPAPAPAPVAAAPMPGAVGAMGFGRQQPAFPGFWNALGLGGQIPPMTGPRGYGYGGMPAMGGGPPLFQGFGTGQGQVPYRPVSTSGFAGYNPREMRPFGFR